MKMKKLLLILLCLPMIGFGQNVNIPDANFKAYLVGEPSINTNGDSEIQVSEASAYNGTISCSSMNISDLTGIEEFTALVSLDINNSNISSLDLTNNILLKYLYCNNNQLSFLDLTQNVNLKTLWCSGNQLTFLDLSQNVNLDTLYSSGNQLTSLDLSYNTALSELDVGFINPMIIDFSMLVNLKSLWFYNLLELDLSNNPMLENLGGGFNDNYLTYVNIRNGNNINLTCDAVLPLSCGSFRLHTNLTCIQVDDVSWANTNWIDNISWNGQPAIDTTFQYFSVNCPPPTSIQEHTTNKELLKVTDLLGRETKQKNQPLFYIYDDGTVEKRIILE